MQCEPPVATLSFFRSLHTNTFDNLELGLVHAAVEVVEEHLNVTVMIADGKIFGEASFFHVHGASGAMIKVTFTEEDNTFVLQRVLKMDDQGKFRAPL